MVAQAPLDLNHAPLVISDKIIVVCSLNLALPLKEATHGVIAWPRLTQACGHSLRIDPIIQALNRHPPA
jgi:hypothetical protein